MPKDYVAAYERIAREEHREHGAAIHGGWDTEPVEALVAEIEADPALAENREACRARIRALRDLYHGDRAFPSDCPSGRRLAAAARSYLGRWPYDREVQDIHYLAMTLSWRYGEAYDYYREHQHEGGLAAARRATVRVSLWGRCPAPAQRGR